MMSGLSVAPQFSVWGSYDKGKPRVRLLLEELRNCKVLASETNVDIWQGVEDKSVAGWSRIAKAFFSLLIGYPLAFFRLLRSPRGHIILLPYPAIFDIFIAWSVARLRGQKIVFDAFISIYDTIVNDRKLLRADSLAARLLYRFEKTALGLADIILVDTDEHGRYFVSAFGQSPQKIVTVLVGAEDVFWRARSNQAADIVPTDLPQRYVLFYGQLIPLHGLQTILKAVEQTAPKGIHWLIVGKGQEEEHLRSFVATHATGNLTWLPWVDYQNLPGLIRNAAVCLGIFGSSDKASRVIPNKMFQILAAGGSIITRDSRGVEEIAEQFPDAVKLIPPANPDALSEAVGAAWRQVHGPCAVPKEAQSQLSPSIGVRKLIEILSKEDQ